MLNTLYLIAFTLFFASSVFAKIDPKQMRPLHLPAQVENSEAVQFSNSVLPKSLTEADSSRSMVSKIIDNSLSYWWDNSDLKKTSVGQVAHQIENNMKADINLSGSGESSDKGHKLSFRLLAAQALAKMEYRGWFKGAIKYDAKNANAEAEVLENLANNKDLVITHSVTSNENKSQLSLRWNW